MNMFYIYETNQHKKRHDISLPSHHFHITLTFSLPPHLNKRFIIIIIIIIIGGLSEVSGAKE